MGNKVVSLNFDKKRHEGLLEWISKEATNNEMSVSGFCISILKKYYMENANDKRKLKGRTDL